MQAVFMQQKMKKNETCSSETKEEEMVGLCDVIHCYTCRPKPT